MTSKPSTKDHYQIFILGGGTAGITVAAQLRRRGLGYTDPCAATLDDNAAGWGWFTDSTLGSRPIGFAIGSLPMAAALVGNSQAV